LLAASLAANRIDETVAAACAAAIERVPRFRTRSEYPLAVAQVVEKRLADLMRCRRLIGTVTIDAAGYLMDVEVGPWQAFCYYLPLAVLMVELARAKGRVLVAVAGAPGAGKTVLSKLLEAFVNALAQTDGFAVAAGLDGFHYPNAVLSAAWGATEKGERVRLRQVKGSEATFDAAAAIKSLRKLHSEPHRVHLLPRYDRKLHEPIKKALAIEPRTAVVLVEGNYVLLNEGRWEGMADVFDLRLYVDSPAAERRRGLIARHVRGGRSRADAERHYDFVDVPNTKVVEPTRARADVIIRKGPCHVVQSLEWACPTCVVGEASVRDIG